MRRGVLAIMLVVLPACATRQQSQELHVKQLIAVSDIVGSIKCAFALALDAERPEGAIKRLNGRVVDLQFIFQYVNTSNTKLDASAQKSGPFVFALSGGIGSVLPFFSGSDERSNTIITTVKARLGLEDYETNICEKVSSGVRQSYGFEHWLSTVIGGLDRNALEAPFGAVDSIVYDGSFGIVRKVGTGADFDVVFFKGRFGSELTRNDVQQIKMTVVPPRKDLALPGPPTILLSQERSRARPASRSSTWRKDSDMGANNGEAANDRPAPPLPDTEPKGEKIKSSGVPKKRTPTPKNPEDLGPLSPEPIRE